MARITFEISDDLNRRLRVKVAEKHGGRKGALGKSIAEAVELWLKTTE